MFYALAKYYINSISSLITFNKAEKFLGIPLTTVENFSYYLTYAYLIFFVSRFSYSLKEREKSPKKVYCIDTGLRNALGLSSSIDYGRCLENIIFLELKRRGYNIYYWKDQYGKEVDFVLQEGRKITLIQVCWDIENPDTHKREIRSLLKAMDEFKLQVAWVITSEYEGEEKINNKTIKFVPAWKWLLEKKIQSNNI